MKRHYYLTVLLLLLVAPGFGSSFVENLQEENQISVAAEFETVDNSQEGAELSEINIDASIKSDSSTVNSLYRYNFLFYFLYKYKYDAGTGINEADY
ncbi:MAG: hypothetical protein HKN67_05950 [Saprospiraceae bacterium]|nr:hypothetical protein [Saprospiraceae bacterium]